MKTIDRYITRLFLMNFAILFVVLMGLFVLVDLIVDLDEFLKGGEFWARQRQVAQVLGDAPADPMAVTTAITRGTSPEALAGQFGLAPEVAQALVTTTDPGFVASTVGTVVKVADFYGPLLVLIYVFFSGLLVVGAMGFTLSGMVRSRELTAVTASGISLYRVAAPVLVVGIGLNALALPCQEWIIPAVANKLTRSKSQVEYAAIADFAVHYASDDGGALFSAASFDAVSGRLTDVSILDRSDQRLTERHIRADAAVWDADRGGWELQNGIAVRPAVAGGGHQATAPEPVGFFPTELSPVVLLARNATIYPRLLPMSDLQSMATNEAVPPAQRGQLTQLVWGRFSLLVMNALVLVMGLPFFLLRAPENMLIQSMKAAGVCMGAWAGGLLMLQMGAPWLPPVAAAWLPVVLYLPAAAILLQFVKT